MRLKIQPIVHKSGKRVAKESSRGLVRDDPKSMALNVYGKTNVSPLNICYIFED